MTKGQKIKLARRAIYASSGTSSEREIERTVIEIKTIKGQDAKIITLSDNHGKCRSYRMEGDTYLISSFPKPIKYEIIESAVDLTKDGEFWAD